MSATFGVFFKDGKLLDCEINEFDEFVHPENDLEVIEIAFRGNSGCISWVNELAQFLPLDTKVYALDNSQQGIYTIGDMIKKIKDYEFSGAEEVF